MDFHTLVPELVCAYRLSLKTPPWFPPAPPAPPWAAPSPT